MKFYCIGDEDTVRGFRLAGIEGQAAETPEEASAALAHVAKRTDVSVVMITDVLAALIRREVDALRIDQGLPLIVEIPGPEGPMPGRKTLREFVQEAVGIRLGQEEV